MTRIAILDDDQRVALSTTDWSVLGAGQAPGSSGAERH
jgi:hypothetical protein